MFTNNEVEDQVVTEVESVKLTSDELMDAIEDSDDMFVGVDLTSNIPKGTYVGRLVSVRPDSEFPGYGIGSWAVEFQTLGTPDGKKLQRKIFASIYFRGKKDPSKLIPVGLAQLRQLLANASVVAEVQEEAQAAGDDYRMPNAKEISKRVNERLKAFQEGTVKVSEVVPKIQGIAILAKVDIEPARDDYEARNKIIWKSIAPVSSDLVDSLETDE